MIPIKIPEEIALMREGGRMLAQIMEELKKEVRPGVTTKALDQSAERKIREDGAKPAFKNYNGFPASICTSVNEEVVHAIPSLEKILQAGDILTLDIGLIWKGYYLDMARTVPVGEISPDAARLLRVAWKALKVGTKKVRPGVTIGDLGNTIERAIGPVGYGIVRELCGHGIGKELHEEPQIPNYGERHAGETLKEGMVICIEPMITLGGWQVQLAKDGQTFVTKDGSLSAPFEDTIAVIENGYEALTHI